MDPLRGAIRLSWLAFSAVTMAVAACDTAEPAEGRSTRTRGTAAARGGTGTFCRLSPCVTHETKVRVEMCPRACRAAR